MSTIPLRARDGGIRAHVLVDEEDYDTLNAYFWALGTDGYARRHEANGKGRRRRIAMHRQILGLTTGDPRESDHINGDRLDNRRKNLRIVTRAENNQNVRHRPGLSGHRNVYWHAASGLWRVQLRHAYVCISGGYFKDVDDAIAAATALRREHMPFAVEATR